MDQGKGMLQPHNLLDELDKIIGEDEGKKALRDGQFGEVLKSAQVDCVIYTYLINLFAQD